MAKRLPNADGNLGDDLNPAGNGGTSPSGETAIGPASNESGRIDGGAGNSPSGVDGSQSGTAPQDPNQAPEAPRRGRGRPKGSGSGPKPSSAETGAKAPGAKAEARTVLDTAQVAAQVKGIHQFIATMTREELFLLSDPQAAMFGKAIADASVHFDFAPSGKIMSLFTLGTVAAIIYVPMFAAIKDKQRMNKPISSVMPATPDDMTEQPQGTYRFQ